MEPGFSLFNSRHMTDPSIRISRNSSSEAFAGKRRSGRTPFNHSTKLACCFAVKQKEAYLEQQKVIYNNFAINIRVKKKVCNSILTIVTINRLKTITPAGKTRAVKSSRVFYVPVHGGNWNDKQKWARNQLYQYVKLEHRESKDLVMTS